jgi:hypothetical protein
LIVFRSHRAVAPPSRLVALVGLGLLVWLASGCQVVGRTTISVGPAGDGTVSVAVALDRQASAAFGDVGRQLQLDDLRAAGWTVLPPSTAADGSTTVTASRPFANDAGLTAILSQLSGPAGPFSDLHLRHRTSLFSTHTGLGGTVDLGKGIDAFADAGLLRQMGITSLTSTLAARRADGGVVPTVRVELAARLPGSSSRSPGAHLVSGTEVWTPALGSTLTVDSAASQPRVVNVVLAGVCLSSTILLVVIGIRRLVVARRSAITASSPVG